jgi:hypothetical protein
MTFVDLAQTSSFAKKQTRTRANRTSTFLPFSPRKSDEATIRPSTFFSAVFFLYLVQLCCCWLYVLFAIPFVDMAEQLDEDSQMRAARAEIMAVADMFHRYRRAFCL